MAKLKDLNLAHQRLVVALARSTLVGCQSLAEMSEASTNEWLLGLCQNSEDYAKSLTSDQLRAVIAVLDELVEKELPVALVLKRYETGQE